MLDFLNLEKIASLLQSNVDVSRLVGGYFIYCFLVSTFTDNMLTFDQSLTLTTF